MIKKRNAAVAATVSFLAPGLGHVYAGDAKKGLSLIGIQYGVLLVCGLAGVLSTFYGIVGYTAFLIAFYIFVIVSATRLALRNKDYRLKSYNRWYWYLGLFIMLFALSGTLSHVRESLLGFAVYSIPTKQMEPTIQVGDFITVDTKYLQPNVGDVIVFRSPKDPAVSYVRRIAALGGDMVSIADGTVIRNGLPVDALSVPESRRRRVDLSITMSERHVPTNEIFVLGDWRDWGNDSRTWGAIPIANIVGKVTYVWYSKDISRIGLKIG